MFSVYFDLKRHLKAINASRDQGVLDTTNVNEFQFNKQMSLQLVPIEILF